MTYVTERFELPEAQVNDMLLRNTNFGFNGLGEAVYLRTYSRVKKDNTQEIWADTVTRVVNGLFSIAKQYTVSNKLLWDNIEMTKLAREMADYIFDMKFLPPGRSLWCMGTDYVYERGGAALQNCGFVDVSHLSHDAGWAMDMLMCGVGVGFSTHNMTGAYFCEPVKPFSEPYVYVIPDSREGWVYSVELLIKSYEMEGAQEINFDYSEIRKAGEPINGFGGTASGPAPLRKAHRRIRAIMTRAARSQSADHTRLVTDIMNIIGACVVAGNVRRSAELAIGLPHNEEFLHLKNYGTAEKRGPSWNRRRIGWMSNNSVLLQKPADFLALPGIADRIRHNGEPGIINLMNVQKYGRFKEKIYGPDAATGFNPCAEQPLESFELCNLVEVFPTRCDAEYEIYRAMELATIWATIVSMLPTHRPETNRVMQKNHRIGVSVSGVADFIEGTSIAHVTKVLRYGYEEVVRPVNAAYAGRFGFSPSIRVTTVKPSGTVSQLAGVSPGMHWPTDAFAIRRVRITENHALVPVLKKAGYKWEKDVYSDNTLCFEFPIDQSKTRSSRNVSMWEQLSTAAFLQREWSDNGVSCTIYFNPKTEGHDIEHALSMYAPQIKAISMLPHTEEGVYAQMPYEGITKQKYLELKEGIQPIDSWSFVAAGSSDGMDSRFCNNDSCEI